MACLPSVQLGGVSTETQCHKHTEDQGEEVTTGLRHLRESSRVRQSERGDGEAFPG